MKDLYIIKHDFKEEDVQKAIKEINFIDFISYMTTLENGLYQSIAHFGTKIFGVDFNENIVFVAICTLLKKNMMAIPVVNDGKIFTYKWVDKRTSLVY
jgi:hypothetical protein